MDDVRDAACVATGLGKVEGVAITVFVASQDVFSSFQPAMGKAYAMHVLSEPRNACTECLLSWPWVTY